MSGGTIWQYLQLSLAGAFLIATINLHHFITSPGTPKAEVPAVSPRTVPAARAAAGDKYTKPVPPPVDDEGITFVERADEMKSISEFALLKMSDSAMKLIKSLNKDERADANPLFDKSAVYSVALILDRGVKDFTREAFTGPTEMALGYDMVRYEITQNDNTTSYILAFRKKAGETADKDKMEKPVLSMFLVARNHDQMYLSLYQEGRPSESRMIESHDAEDYIPTKVANAGWIRHQ